MKKIVLLLSVLSLFTVTWADSTNSTTTDCITLSELRQKINNNEDVTQVNTGCITDMSKLFYNNSTFNQDISGWDVSSVVNMSKMFMDRRR
jgi:surface protein